MRRSYYNTGPRPMNRYLLRVQRVMETMKMFCTEGLRVNTINRLRRWCSSTMSKEETKWTSF